MTNKILNEKKYVEFILNGGEIINPYVAARILCKYYLLKENKRNEIKQAIVGLLSSRMKKIKSEEWEERIDKYIDSIKRDKKKREKEGKAYNLHQIDYIHITKNELKSIKIIENNEIEILAFVMLVNSKINRLMYDTKAIGLTCDKELFEDAGLRFTTKNKKYINYMLDLGLVKVSTYNKSLYVEVCFAEMDFDDVEFSITDFREIGLIYDKWCGNKVGFCSRCTRLYSIRSNNHIKCKQCKHDEQLQLQRESMKKIRGNNDNKICEVVE